MTSMLIRDGDWESFQEWIGDTHPHISLTPWQEEIAHSVFSCRTFFIWGGGKGAGKRFVADLLCEYAKDQGLEVDDGNV